MRLCSIVGCIKKHDARGFCHKHYLRWKTHGDPLRVIKASEYRKKTDKKCSSISCDRAYLAKGFCRYHYLKNKRESENVYCKIDGCLNKIIAIGLCNRHYCRLKRNKSLEEKSCHELSPKERLLKFVKIDVSSECWLWTGGTNRKGYGSLSYGGKTRIAHRMSFELYKGEIPKGLLVCHLCDIPRCINPSHLFIGTNLDNCNDKFSKKRERYLNGQENGNSKLKNKEVVIIKKMLLDGVDISEISRQFKVSPQNIGFIYKNITWRHINVE